MHQNNSDAEMTTQEEEEEEESLTLKRTKKIKIKRTFDFSKYKTRKIALELAYCGANHFGFSSQGCVQASSETLRMRRTTVTFERSKALCSRL